MLGWSSCPGKLHVTDLMQDLSRFPSVFWKKRRKEVELYSLVFLCLQCLGLKGGRLMKLLDKLAGKLVAVPFA